MRSSTNENIARDCRQHILWLTACTTLSNFTFQFSDPWVAGVTAELLLYMSIPAVWLSSIYVLHDSFTLRESAGVVIVLVAILIGILPRMLQERHEVGDESNPAWAVVLYGLSAGLQGLVMMFQERATRAPNDLRPATALFWYNLYCCVTALFTIPMEAVPYLNGTVTGRSLSDAFQNQVHSLCCAAGAPYAEDVLTGYCKVGAWLWPQVYALSHAGMFYLNARLIQRFNALWTQFVRTKPVLFVSSNFMAMRLSAAWTLCLLCFVITEAARRGGSQVDLLKNVEKPAELQGDAGTDEGSLVGPYEPSLKEWIDLLDDPRRAVRLDAVEEIGKMGTKAEAAIPKLTSRGLSDGSIDIRVATVKILGNMGKKAADSVTAIFNGVGWEVKSANDPYLKAASAALAKIGKKEPNKVLQVARQRMTYIPWYTKWLAIKTCGLLGKEAANLTPLIHKMKYDDNHNVQTAAARALYLIAK
ncbi:unnamed protein product [Symbiodinium microadriaticum]|nr:unnamed protein product [Symbiodinium microadriaticum]